MRKFFLKDLILMPLIAGSVHSLSFGLRERQMDASSPSSSFFLMWLKITDRLCVWESGADGDREMKTEREVSKHRRAVNLPTGSSQICQLLYRVRLHWLCEVSQAKLEDFKWHLYLHKVPTTLLAAWINTLYSLWPMTHSQTDGSREP